MGLLSIRVVASNDGFSKPIISQKYEKILKLHHINNIIRIEHLSCPHHRYSCSRFNFEKIASSGECTQTYQPKK